MENSSPIIEYYNIKGVYSTSRRVFKKYIRKEILFYKGLHDLVVEKGFYGTRANCSKPDEPSLDY